ncbi:MAG TPA: hypothetical protein VKY31_02345 [Terriglobia bacterium]|nr:hypothetical protein [Terriglobia bacterium]
MPETMSLLYDSSYNLHCQLMLKSGRRITLDGLQQEMTYAGLLEGTPNAEFNKEIVQTALRKAQTVAFHCTPHLIEPTRRDYFRTPGDMSSVRRLPEWLPLVTCIGSFKGGRPVRDPKKDISVLTVLWFQEEYALPILEPALSHLVALDWDSLAVDIEID